MPEISVILPIYKVEEYLRPCVDSILGQTFTDFELIMVDDGSPDGCGAICDQYAKQDHRIRVIHQENRGLSGARNTGIEAAAGNYLAFIDSDDLVNKCYLEELFGALTGNSADVSVCDFDVFDNEKGYDYERNTVGSGTVLLSNTEAVKSIYSYSDGSIFVTAWGFLFKKHLFDGMRFPLGKIGEDLSLIPRVLYGAERVVQVKKALYVYRIREGSITHRKYTAKIFDDIEALDTCIAFFEERHETELAAAAEYVRKNTLSYYTLLARKSGFYGELPAQYKMGRIRAVRNLRENLPRKFFLNRLYRIYPRYILFEERFRRLLETMGLRDPKDRWV